MGSVSSSNIIITHTPDFLIQEITKLDISLDKFKKYINLLKHHKHNMSFMSDILCNLANYKFSDQTCILKCILEFKLYLTDISKSEVIFRNIKIILDKYNDDINNCIVQSYDQNRVNKLFTEINQIEYLVQKEYHPYLTYIHEYVNILKHYIHSKPRLGRTKRLNNMLECNTNKHGLILYFIQTLKSEQKM